ncbi:MAG: HEAT repeat domain-containing protein [Chloroflexi bacterium]|nr:HEAT repeat domain-containing protein [Chloroflexota bacterium]
MDLLSLLVGAAAGALLTALIFSQLPRLRALRSSVSNQASATRARLTRSAEAAYRDAVVEFASSLHIAGSLAPLEDLSVEPRFIPAPHPFDPTEPDDPTTDLPQQLVPFVPDWPQAAGPYSLPAVPLTHVLRGSPGVALLGLPGSGRTVALALMALRTARDMEVSAGSLLPEKRLPVYVHLADLPLDPAAYEDAVDPLQPLLDAAHPHLRGIAGRLLGVVRAEFAGGRGLLLADGWDEITPEQQRRVADWLEALFEAYPGNRTVIAAGVKGYGPLVALGLAPVYIAPWNDAAHAELARRWAAAWPRLARKGRQAAPAPEADLVQRVSRGNRGWTPLDVTLRVWAAYESGELPASRVEAYHAYIERAAPDPALVPALEQAAALLLVDEPDRAGLTAEELGEQVEAVAKAAGERPSMGASAFINTITRRSQLLIERGKRLVFAHPAVAGYLAARALRSRPLDDDLACHANSRLFMPFVAGMRDVRDAVEARLEAPDTLLLDNLLELAAWAADADLNAPWRAAVFTRLSNLLLDPVAYPAVRERVAAALVTSRDPNVAFVFREGLKSDGPDLRRICVLGLGAVGDPETVVAVSEMIEDEDAAVETCAALALGALAAPAAITGLLQVLLAGRDLARRAAAEVLGETNLAGEGHDVLREAIEEADPAIRKAAMYGLARARAPWADEIISDAEKHDEQWLVRAAAGTIMDRKREGRLEVRLPARPPTPELAQWLAPWLENQGRMLRPGKEGMEDLIGALEADDEAIRLAAAETLGALGAPEGVRALYARLRDEHPEIRDAAHRALGSISFALDCALPGVA